MTRLRWWWRILVTLATDVTQPRVDVMRVDNAVERLVVDSALSRTAQSLAARVSVAWDESWCRRALVAPSRKRL